MAGSLHHTAVRSRSGSACRQRECLSLHPAGCRSILSLRSSRGWASDKLLQTPGTPGFAAQTEGSGPGPGQASKQLLSLNTAFCCLHIHLWDASSRSKFCTGLAASVCKAPEMRSRPPLPESSCKLLQSSVQVFNYRSGAHDVIQTPTLSCSALGSNDAKTLAARQAPTPVRVPVDQARIFNYACSVGDHCDSGQLVQITVSGDALLPATSLLRVQLLHRQGGKTMTK